MAQPGFRNMQVNKNFMSHVAVALEILFRVVTKKNS